VLILPRDNLLLANSEDATLTKNVGTAQLLHNRLFSAITVNWQTRL